MFGWEFPPLKSGGLGTACYDLCRGLKELGVEITFVVPRLDERMESIVELVGANMTYVGIPAHLYPYQRLPLNDSSENYGARLLEEVDRYTQAAIALAKKPHDVIHAHDWMTYQAGIKAKEISGKPLVVHIHATEGDRTGGNPHPLIAAIEQKGMEAADVVIANSNYTKKQVLAQYPINPDKIKVVHWGIDDKNPAYMLGTPKPFDEKLVLFLGRVTLQKGPDYFVKLAEKVFPHAPNTKFVIAGNGDMLPQVIKQVHTSNLQDKFLFTGFAQGDEVHKLFQMADLYVMPSVSEPFGLVALESLKNNTPVLMSKQSGVSEVVSHALKSDFWDVEDMASKVISYLNMPALSKELTLNTQKEASKFNLIAPAKACLDCYRGALL